VDGLLGFAVAGFALAGSPGPNTLSLAATGAAFGARRGVGYMAGVNIGMVAVMAITASGVVSLFLAAPGATPIVTTVAAGYFAFLAYRIATAPPLTENTELGRQPSFAGGVFLSLVNPKGYAAMAALFSGFVLVPYGESNRACGDHRRGQLGMANRRSGAHALLSRSSHKSGDQCDFCRSSHRVRRLGAVAMNLTSLSSILILTRPPMLMRSPLARSLRHLS